ncbi:3-hydroxyacyl-CoA dehydrogenase, C-terminal domain [Teratosphaeria destructans]|uniref:3-hydroxyacyl-CoA dehydrogenase, C-terminal domain n=1 Tax=Teratosphaeria destructans TaxID=418781 RepID=A0A9W7W204_9PEZI|nr:3-hydroxyacyl-CoA dehydrogenase, C-terminal domain [Teratosphaeria destructans]
MGLGIALVAARAAQVPVTVVDNSQKSLDKGLAFAGKPPLSIDLPIDLPLTLPSPPDKLLAKDVSKQKLSQADADSARARLTSTTHLDHLADADMIIEAVPEIVSLKQSVFASLARVAPPHAILATNTSSISITLIARATCPPDDPTDLSAASRVVSTHFMNPVPVQKGVEIISALQTSPATLATALHFCKRMGKIPSQSADSPGFLANRILMPYINEAIICLETGVGGEEDIDAIMKNGTNVPMGPLALADFIGLDTCLAIMEVLHSQLGDSKYRPAVRLRQMVDAGWLGKKSGKGFYAY